MKVIIYIALALSSAIAGAAELPLMEHNCTKPEYEVTTQNVGKFRSDVTAYKLCLIDYIKEHQRQIEIHHNIAEGAIGELSAFKRSLK